MQLPKIEVKKILYATDLSDSARYVFAYALILANLYRSKLVMLHVLPEDPDLDGLVRGYVDPGQWQKIKEQHLQDAPEALIGKRGDSAVIREVLGEFYRQAGKEKMNGPGRTSTAADGLDDKRGAGVGITGRKDMRNVGLKYFRIRIDGAPTGEAHLFQTVVRFDETDVRALTDR